MSTMLSIYHKEENPTLLAIDEEEKVVYVDGQPCELTQQDVVRHVMVQRIIEAYAKYEENRFGKEKGHYADKSPHPGDRRGGNRRQ